MDFAMPYLIQVMREYTSASPFSRGSALGSLAGPILSRLSAPFVDNHGSSWNLRRHRQGGGGGGGRQSADVGLSPVFDDGLIVVLLVPFFGLRGGGRGGRSGLFRLLLPDLYFYRDPEEAEKEEQ